MYGNPKITANFSLKGSEEKEERKKRKRGEDYQFFINI